MDTTLVVNPGSASKKYALFKGGVHMLSVTFERTREGYGKCYEINGTRELCEGATEKEFDASLSEALAIAKKNACIGDESEITHVAVRIVAPGTYFTEHRKISEAYLEKLELMRPAAPLHIPPTLREIKKVRELLPEVLIIGASDSAFHSTMPSHARLYSIPDADSAKYDVYRFGYHGLSVASVVRALFEFPGGIPERTVVCHIGGGVSVTALKNGISIETSMGFTPASGLMMGSRAGDIDPGALIYLLEMKDLDDGEAHAYIQERGGFKGLLGTSDLRIALSRRAKGDGKAEEAVRMFFYRIRKEIGASIAVLGGIDALVLTATAAERNPLVRTLVCEGFQDLGIVVDEERNESLAHREGILSPENGPVAILAIHTDEMAEMARIAENFS